MMTDDAQPPLEALNFLILQMLGLAGFAENIGCSEIAASVRAIVDEAVEWRKHIIAGLGAGGRRTISTEMRDDGRV